MGKTRRRGPLPSRRIVLWPVAAVGGISLLLFSGLYLLDFFLSPQHPAGGPLGQLLHYDPETAENALGNLAQVVVAVLGIVITVVSIVVQLAANRYTPRITDMFFRDRANLAMLGFFVTTCIFATWVSLSVGARFMPHRSIAATLLLVTLSLLLMIPYFAYVFDFLDPECIVARIKEQTLESALRARPGAQDLAARQHAVLRGIEHLCDIAVNALSNRDKLIASGAVNALKDLLVSYLALKIANPPAWYEVGDALRDNPDFVALLPGPLSELSRTRTWVEWKVLRQLQAIYAEALAALPDINLLVAIDTRYVGESALEGEDLDVLRLVIKFFNTFIRVTLNGKDVRTAGNVLNQYRQLAERVLAFDRGELLLDIAYYLRYYAQLAQGLHLGLVTETVAYDLAALCEAAFNAGSRAHEGLLRCFLALDQGQGAEAARGGTLRGVRKAQVKLATAYLERGHEELARKIHLDLSDEPPQRLRSIRDELLLVEAKDFWEIIDRGTDFDYLSEPRKEQLQVFFSWFPLLDPPHPAAERGLDLPAGQGPRDGTGAAGPVC